MTPQKKPRGVVTRLEDRSLQAYKDWINGIMEGLMGKEALEQDDSMTEEKWRRRHASYWRKIDQARQK